MNGLQLYLLGLQILLRTWICEGSETGTLEARKKEIEWGVRGYLRNSEQGVSGKYLTKGTNMDFKGSKAIEVFRFP